MKHVIKITQPKTHTFEEINELFNNFSQLYPKEFSRWQSMEKSKAFEPYELNEIQALIISYLKDVTEWQSRDALLTAYVDFRTIINSK